MTRKFVLSVSLMVFALSVHSQIGLRTHYNTNQYGDWNDFFQSIPSSGSLNSNERVFSSSLEFAFDYWLRLPDKRIEFFPFISYHQATTNIELNSSQLVLRQIGAGLITHIYLLDLIGDCDCPTFSKQGTFIKKGLFLMAGVGADYSIKAVNDNYTDGNIDANFQAGLGLDIGLTDVITITPLIRYKYYPDISWHEMAPLFGVDINNVNTAVGQLAIGVRVGIRLDYR